LIGKVDDRFLECLGFLHVVHRNNRLQKAA
jgi:hypothetical protein